MKYCHPAYLPNITTIVLASEVIIPYLEENNEMVHNINVERVAYILDGGEHFE